MEEDQKKLQSLSEELQKLQDDLQTAVDNRQTLEAQQQENKAVKKEFDGLTDDTDIYKLVGPVLLKQEKTEAVSAVEGRLDFIGKEVTRTESRIKELQEGSQKKQSDMMMLQQKMQQAQQGKVAG